MRLPQQVSGGNKAAYTQVTAKPLLASCRVLGGCGVKLHPHISKAPTKQKKNQAGKCVKDFPCPCTGHAWGYDQPVAILCSQ